MDAHITDFQMQGNELGCRVTFRHWPPAEGQDSGKMLKHPKPLSTNMKTLSFYIEKYQYGLGQVLIVYLSDWTLSDRHWQKEVAQMCRLCGSGTASSKQSCRKFRTYSCMT